MGCDLTIDCKVTANKEITVPLLTDLFSTDYETDFTTAKIKVEHSPLQVQKQLACKTVLEYKESGEGSALEEIFDCRSDLNGIGWRFNSEGNITVTGQLVSQAIGRLSGSGAPVFLEKSEPVELICELNQALSSEISEENSVIEPNIQVNDVSFNINGDRAVEVRVGITLSGCVYRLRDVNVVENVLINSDKPKEKSTEYALKMYYAEENEEIFAVAKRYNTKPGLSWKKTSWRKRCCQPPACCLFPFFKEDTVNE